MSYNYRLAKTQSKYSTRLEYVANSPRGWWPIDANQRTRNAPSAMRKRYPDFDFKAEPNEHGLFTLYARRLFDI